MIDYDRIMEIILGIYDKCNVKSFPINCIQLLKSYGIMAFSYDEVDRKDPQLLDRINARSKEALRLANIVYYNGDRVEGRIKFSLMHELGHIVLGHCSNPTDEMETEADYFASHFLAPRILIHYSGCKNHADVYKTFGLSEEAAVHTFNNYRKWRRNAVHRKFTATEKMMYKHFYNPELDKLVYKISYCITCTEELHNTDNRLCPECQESEDRMRRRFAAAEANRGLLGAEGHWLYADDL